MVKKKKKKQHSCFFSFAIRGINYSLKYIKTENSYFKLLIFHIITVFTVFFDQIDDLVNKRDLFFTGLIVDDSSMHYILF